VRTFLENQLSFVQNSISFISFNFNGDMDGPGIQQSINTFHSAIAEIKDSIENFEFDQAKKGAALDHIKDMEANFKGYCDQLEKTTGFDNFNPDAMRFLEKVRDAEKLLRSDYNL
jgi:hypothetical protein